jgi:hypothetical protein
LQLTIPSSLTSPFVLLGLEDLLQIKERLPMARHLSYSLLTAVVTMACILSSSPNNCRIKMRTKRISKWVKKYSPILLSVLAIAISITTFIQGYHQIQTVYRNIESQNSAYFRANRAILDGNEADPIRNSDGTYNVNFRMKPMEGSFNVEAHLQVIIEKANGTV